MEANSFLGIPLACAPSKGNREAVEFLLQNNAYPNSVVKNVRTPLIISSGSPHGSSVGITKLLVQMIDEQRKVLRNRIKLNTTVQLARFENGDHVEVMLEKNGFEGSFYEAVMEESLIEWDCVVKYRFLVYDHKCP